MRLAVGQGPKPSPKDLHAACIVLIDRFPVNYPPKAAAPFCGNDSGGMIGKSSKNGYVMAGFRPMAGEFGGTGGRRAHLRRKILRDVENFHANLEAIA